MENQGILLCIGIALIILLICWYIWAANNPILLYVARQQNHHAEELIDIPEHEKQNVDINKLFKQQ